MARLAEWTDQPRRGAGRDDGFCDAGHSGAVQQWWTNNIYAGIGLLAPEQDP